MHADPTNPLTIRHVHLTNEATQLKFGQTLARATPVGSRLYLEGDLGSGKTTLVRGFLQGLGYTGAVKSPTYTLVEIYQFGTLRICHFDLYRLNDPSELLHIGIADYFTEQDIVLVEWPRYGLGILPTANLYCKLRLPASSQELGRDIELQAFDNIGQLILQQMDD